MMQRIVNYISETEVSMNAWLVSFTSIVFIRFLFESMASATNAGIVASDTYTFVHTWMFFIATAFGLSYIIGLFTKKYSEALKLSLFGLPLIWLGPLIDIVISNGKGYRIAYISDTGLNIFRDMLTFFGPNLHNGATLGLRVEMALILIGLGCYVYVSTRNIGKGVTSALLSYAFIFTLFSIPGIMYTVGHLQNPYGSNEQIVNYLSRIVLQSNLSHNTFRDALTFVSLGRLSEMAFDKLISQIYVILTSIFGILLFYRIDKQKFIAIAKNSRPERIGFFLSLVISGMGAALLFGHGKFSSIVDSVGVISLLISWTCAWIFAVHINDMFDTSIDSISHKDRPIIRNIMSLEDTRQAGIIFLITSIVSGWAASFTTLYFGIMYMAASYIYSVPPLRLKKYPFVGPFLIAIACLLSLLAGFFFVSFDKRIQIFPAYIALGIILIFSLIINIKDLEDREGDEADGIYTLPVIFKNNGKRVVAACFALGVILVPVFLSFPILYITAVPLAISGYVVIQNNPRPTKKIFLFGLIFFLANIGIILSLLYLGTRLPH